MKKPNRFLNVFQVLELVLSISQAVFYLAIVLFQVWY